MELTPVRFTLIPPFLISHLHLTLLLLSQNIKIDAEKIPRLLSYFTTLITATSQRLTTNNSEVLLEIAQRGFSLPISSTISYLYHKVFTVLDEEIPGIKIIKINLSTHHL